MACNMIVNEIKQQSYFQKVVLFFIASIFYFFIRYSAVYEEAKSSAAAWVPALKRVLAFLLKCPGANRPSAGALATPRGTSGSALGRERPAGKTSGSVEGGKDRCSGSSRKLHHFARRSDAVASLSCGWPPT